MQEVKAYIPLSRHDIRLLTDDEYYRQHYKKDFEKTLVSVTFSHKNETYNVLSMLFFGSEDGNAWIGTSFWKKHNNLFGEIGLGEPMHGAGNVIIEYEDIRVEVIIDEE